MNSWVSNISVTDLKFLAPPLFIFENDPEDAAQFLYKEGMSNPMATAGDKDELIKYSQKELNSRPPKKYWEQVK